MCDPYRSGNESYISGATLEKLRRPREPTTVVPVEKKKKKRNKTCNETLIILILLLLNIEYGYWD